MNLIDLFENISAQQRRVGQLPADFRPPQTSPQLSGPYPGRNATQGYLVGEGEDRVDTLVTNGLGLMRGPRWLDAVAAIKYQVGERDYRERKQFYDFFVQQLVDRYGKKDVAEGKSNYNFDIEDLKRLERIRDLPTLKAQALALISKPSTKPMKPEKVEWFKNALENMNSPIKVIKLMYDLMLSGEGHAVVGSTASMNPNTYRRTFGEQDVLEKLGDNRPSLGSKRDQGKIVRKWRNARGMGESGVAEGMAQDEAEETNGWRAELVNQINYNTFEVKMTNARSKESANFIVRPVDMISIGPTLQIETMDVHDLQTGRTESWTSDDPQPDGGIVYAIAMMFWDNKELQKKLWTIVDQSKDQDLMPGLDQRRSIGQEVDADAYIDSGEKTQAAMAKMKQGMSEGAADNNPMAAAVVRRILHGRLDLLQKYGAEAVLRAVEDVTDGDTDWEEIGSSDVSAYVQYVEQQLQDRMGSREEMNEAATTTEDVLSAMKKKLNDYLQNVADAIKTDPTLKDKLPKNLDQLKAIKTIRTDDGHEIKIRGNEDDGFRVSIRNREMSTPFKSLEEAVMASEMYCARRRMQALEADYMEEN
jgi:hypothetical protein